MKRQSQLRSSKLYRVAAYVSVGAVVTGLWFAIFSGGAYIELSASEEHEFEEWWSWEVVEQSRDHIRFKAVNLTIPLDEIKKVSGDVSFLLKDGVHIETVETMASLLPDGTILLDLKGNNFEKADELHVNVWCECLRRGIFGRGAYSNSWRSDLEMSNGKVVP
ncbi:hypothetical protein Mal52_44280 [Symmachiella dynata]|uniref:Uncharacterized protein n=1 Tax=Symmachiella dynata TaxID=2527995 RepID=A0A517ZTX6_9PLAN|nr:hypothetical protein [Symmachiella dynata]QDU45931.1 hypothetical protein Mal52_44280 [Symmachiella dynata]